MCKTFSIKLIFKISLVLTSMQFLGCASVNQKIWTSSSKNSAEVSEQEIGEIESAEKLFADAKYAEAKQKYIEFQKKYPQSIYLQSARLAEGQCSEYLGNPERAGEIYDGVILNTQSAHPQIAAIAIFRKSFVYEILGDDLKALTTLLDLNVHQDQLPTEVGLIQLPGRMAMLYNKLGQLEESEKYIQILNQNLEVTLKGKITKAQLAESYLLMGSLSSKSINETNWTTFARGFKVSSLFLIKSIESNQSPWSDKAQELLSQHMKNYWEWIRLAGSSKDPISKSGISLREAIENQKQMAHDFLETLTILDLRRPVEVGQWTNLQKKLFDQLDSYQKDVQILFVQRSQLNELSAESLNANSLKRSGKLVPVPESKFAEPKGVSNPVTK